MAILIACFAVRAFAQPATDVIHLDNLTKPQSFAGEWKFKTGDDPAWASPDYNDKDWGEIKAPLTWVDQGYSH